jgi:hypothetical protein
MELRSHSLSEMPFLLSFTRKHPYVASTYCNCSTSRTLDIEMSEQLPLDGTWTNELPVRHDEGSDDDDPSTAGPKLSVSCSQR